MKERSEIASALATMEFSDLVLAMGERKTWKRYNGVRVTTLRDGSYKRVFVVEWVENNPDYAAGKLRGGRYVRPHLIKEARFPFTIDGMMDADDLMEALKGRDDLPKVHGNFNYGKF